MNDKDSKHKDRVQPVKRVNACNSTVEKPTGGGGSLRLVHRHRYHHKSADHKKQIDAGDTAAQEVREDRPRTPIFVFNDHQMEEDDRQNGHSAKRLKILNF